MEFRLVAAGDSAWSIELPDRIDVEVNTRATEIAALVERAALPAVTDVVVGYRSVMVYFDPLASDASTIRARLDVLAAAPAPAGAARSTLIDVPACYGGSYGPDIADVAAFGRCSPDDVIRLHADTEYRVFVVGFVPGFAYMAPVDARIAIPRRSSPRLKVPAGSVAVAAGQTGIYPAETPGGWHVIGRTPIRPYDPDRERPFLFHPGDRVRFHRITESEYRATTAWGDS